MLELSWSGVTGPGQPISWTSPSSAASARVAGHQVAWLTDAIYFQGRINLDLRRPEAALDAWTLFTGRSSLQSEELELWLASLGGTSPLSSKET